MGKEHGKRQPALTLEAVAAGIKEDALKRGQQPPTVIVQGSRQIEVAEFDTFDPTHEGRAQQMFTAGFLLAQAGNVGQLRQVFFMSEAWMSVAQEDKPASMTPSLDPNRKEVLMVSAYTVGSRKSGLVVFEMVRDTRGRLVELKDFKLSQEYDQEENPLLEAFVLGFETGKGGIIM
jgi:hypothetical protein